MDWTGELHDRARDLRDRLDREHPGVPSRRRLRLLPIVAALALAVGGVAWQLRPADPVASIASQYRDQTRLRQMLKTETWDPELRGQFERTLAEIDRALLLAQDAVRRSPDNPEFRELCHIAYRAKSHLFAAYRPVQGD